MIAAKEERMIRECIAKLKEELKEEGGDSSGEEHTDRRQAGAAGAGGTTQSSAQEAASEVTRIGATEEGRLLLARKGIILVDPNGTQGQGVEDLEEPAAGQGSQADGATPAEAEALRES